MRMRLFSPANLLIGIAATGVLSPAVARAQRDTAVLAKAPVMTPVARPAARTTTAPRIRAARRAPLEALEARGANPAGPFARITELQRDSIIENSRSLLGIRYKWAGETPERGVDCSGLVRYVFAKLGIDLPHSSAVLAKLGAPVAKDTANMQPGDLLVFSKQRTQRISHVGIYVGDGMMVHASSNSKAVVETPIEDFRGLRLRSVRRVIAVDSAASAVPEWRP